MNKLIKIVKNTKDTQQNNFWKKLLNINIWGGAHGVIVIVVGNGNGNMSSNPG